MEGGQKEATYILKFNLLLERDVCKHLEKSIHPLFNIRQKYPNNFPYTQQLQCITTIVGNR